MSLIIPANSAAASGGFAVDNSVRMDGLNNTTKFTRTFGSAGNRKKWTMSMWVKRGKIGLDQKLMGKYTSQNDRFALLFNSSNQLQIFWGNSGGNKQITTNRLFRDTSAFYNFTFIIDTGNSTESDRMQIWVNGVRETSMSSTAYPTSSQDLPWNDSGVNEIGSYGGGNNFNGYLAEVVFQNDNADTPVDKFISFDEDSGICIPIEDVSELTLGTNGFYLDFKDSSALGNDASGSNNFTPAGITAIDQTTDTPTNNFATLNPLAPMDTGSSVQALSEGNLQANGPAEGVGWQTAYATIPLSSGKWYIEVLVIQVAGNEVVIGLNPDNFSNTSDTAHSNSTAGVWYQSNGGKWVSGSSSSYGATYDDGDIISVLINMDDSEVTFYKNDASQGTISFNTNLTAASSIIFGTNGVEVTSITQFNFGSPPYAISSGNQDGNGYGNFEFATKGGYALNTKNLAEYG